MREYLCSEEFKENLIEAIENVEPDADSIDILHMMESLRNDIVADAAQMAEDYDDVDAEQVIAFLDANPDFRDALIKTAAEEVFDFAEWDDDDEEDEE